MVHPKVHEVGQKWPNSQKGSVQGMEARTGNLGRNAEKSWEHPGMKFGNLKSKWNWVWSGTSKMTRRASVSTEVTKGRPWKMWAHCWTTRGTSLHRTGKRLRYWKLSLSWSFLERLAFWNPGSWGPGEKLQQEHVSLGEGDQARAYLTGHTCFCGPSWWDAPTSSEGPGITVRPLKNPWWLRSSWILEESKCPSYL